MLEREQYKDIHIYIEANSAALLPQVMTVDFEQALRSALITHSLLPSMGPGADIHFCQAILNFHNPDFGKAKV